MVIWIRRQHGRIDGTVPEQGFSECPVAVEGKDWEFRTGVRRQFKGMIVTQ